MRSRSGIYLHVLVALFVTSAPAAAISAEVEDRPAYNLLRWQEDYRFLQDPDRRTDFFDPVKYIPFDEIGSSYLTVSAQLREQSIRYDAPQFGVRNTGKDNYRFHRLLVAWDWHIDPSLRAFLELGNMTAEGKRRPLARV